MDNPNLSTEQGVYVMIAPNLPQGTKVWSALNYRIRYIQSYDSVRGLYYTSSNPRPCKGIATEPVFLATTKQEARTSERDVTGMLVRFWGSVTRRR